jgi:hypothetical protein
LPNVRTEALAAFYFSGKQVTRPDSDEASAIATTKPRRMNCSRHTGNDGQAMKAAVDKIFERRHWQGSLKAPPGTWSLARREHVAAAD